MKNTAILGGIAVAILLVLGLRKDRKSTVMEEKIHDLQDKFKSLDAVVA
jgi:hypothetical protein